MIINGKDYSSEKFDIIILAGQSNCYGYGLGETEDYKEDGRIMILDDTVEPTYVKGASGKDELKLGIPYKYEISQAKEVISASGKKVGCLGLWFAEEYLKNDLKNGRKILLVKSAVGGTGLCKDQWTKEGCLCLRMQDMVDKALSLNPENRVVALLWHQGECDAFENAGKPLNEIEDLYKRDFAVFIDYIYGKYGKIPFISGGFADEWSKGYKAECDAVLKGIKETMKSIHGGFVPTEGLLSNNQKVGNGDDIHFCRDALRYIGKEYYKEYKSIKG